MISTSGIRGTGYMKCMPGSFALCWKMLIHDQQIWCMTIFKPGTPLHSSDKGGMSIKQGWNKLSTRNLCSCSVQDDTTYLSLAAAAWSGLQFL